MIDDGFKIDLGIINTFGYFNPILDLVGLLRQYLHLFIKLRHLSFCLFLHGRHRSPLDFSLVLRFDFGTSNMMRKMDQSGIIRYI